MNQSVIAAGCELALEMLQQQAVCLQACSLLFDAFRCSFPSLYEQCRIPFGNSPVRVSIGGLGLDLTMPQTKNE